jgi:hypothetical protein
VKLPSWFEPLLCKGSVESEFRSLNVPPNQALVPRTLVPDRVFTYHGPESLRAEGGDLLLVAEAGPLVVSIADVDIIHGEQIAFASADERFWIAEYSGMLLPFALFMRTNTNVIKWKATVWSQWCTFGRSGMWKHRAEVLRHHGAVTVLGIGYEGAYIECFDAMNGRPLLRFITSVLDVDDR